MFIFGNGESRHGLDINKIKGIKSDKKISKSKIFYDEN